MTEVFTDMKDVVYCNHCGTMNPRNSVICCSCRHVHVATYEVLEERTPATTIEQWVWNLLAIACGVVICLARAIPIAGATFNAALLGSITGSLAIPVVIAIFIGKGSWTGFSRWFLRVAIALTAIHLLEGIIGRVHMH